MLIDQKNPDTNTVINYFEVVELSALLSKPTSLFLQFLHDFSSPFSTSFDTFFIFKRNSALPKPEKFFFNCC